MDLEQKAILACEIWFVLVGALLLWFTGSMIRAGHIKSKKLELARVLTVTISVVMVLVLLSIVRLVHEPGETEGFGLAVLAGSLLNIQMMLSMAVSNRIHRYKNDGALRL